MPFPGGVRGSPLLTFPTRALNTIYTNGDRPRLIIAQASRTVDDTFWVVILDPVTELTSYALVTTSFANKIVNQLGFVRPSYKYKAYFGANPTAGTLDNWIEIDW